MGNCNMQPAPLIQVGEYEFDPNDVLGAGHHGMLFQGSPKNDKLFEIAVKQINHKFDVEGLQQAKVLFTKLASVDHENIARYIDYYYENKEGKLYLIIEFCAHGNLHDLMQSDLKFSPLSNLKVALKYCQQIIKGLLAIHEKNIIHQNLRPHNILVNYDTMKISDFALNELEKCSVNKEISHKLSIYRAPELATGKTEPTQRCDIWSLGVIMYQLLYKNRPVEILSREYKLSEIKTGKCLVLDDLISRCLKVNPEERIGTEALKRHLFVSFDVNTLKEEGSSSPTRAGGSF